MALFSFNFNSFQITDTRSAHTDTDYASLTLKIGGAAPTTVCKPMGNLNNGTFNVGLSYSGQEIPTNTTVVMNYLILNSSLPSSAVIAGVQTLGNRIASVATNLPPLASSLQILSSQFAQEIGTITNHPSCDGLVAAEQNTITYDQLVNYAAQFPFYTQATPHTGTKAPGNCNSRPSAYVTHWSLMQVAAIPNVTLKALGDSKTKDTALYILGQNQFQGQVKTGPKNAQAQVYQQSPASGLEYVGYTVELLTRAAQ
jgi:hypothetical protein